MTVSPVEVHATAEEVPKDPEALNQRQRDKVLLDSRARFNNNARRSIQDAMDLGPEAPPYGSHRNPIEMSVSRRFCRDNTADWRRYK